jgi:peptidyl-prolyl cis-trans isomerase A (cyclophilin A)
MRAALLPLAAAVALAVAGCGHHAPRSGASAALLHPAQLHAKAPRLFHVTFTTTKGAFVLSVDRAWAPRGADRFYNLVKAHFYDGASFFRVVPKFVVQFGISPDPQVSKAWVDAVIPDDPRSTSNKRGTVTFASAGPGTRTTQIFINLGDNSRLDAQGFTPFGKVTPRGMEVVDKLFSGYRDQPTQLQPQIENEGNAFLKKKFPKLDHIVTARIGS